MELKDFVKNTLVSIAGGVEEATKEQQEKNKRGTFSIRRGEKEADYINFDVAVTTASEKSGKATGEAKILIAGGGLEGQISQSTENISRVKFKVHFYG